MIITNPYDLIGSLSISTGAREALAPAAPRGISDAAIYLKLSPEDIAEAVA